MKPPWSNVQAQGSLVTSMAGLMDSPSPDVSLSTNEQLDFYYGLVKRQLLRFQSPTSHLYPDKSSNSDQANLRDSIYCNAAVWTLYQVKKMIIY